MLINELQRREQARCDEGLLTVVHTHLFGLLQSGVMIGRSDG